MTKHLLFVYGTLRKDGVNAMPTLYPNSTFIGNSSVNGRLFDMGGYPAIVLDDEGTSVIGEVYEIGDDTLARLDEFELDAGYDRKQVEISIDGEVSSCWIYGPPAEHSAGKPEVTSGDWIEYQHSR